MLRKLVSLIVVLTMLTLVGCAAHVHKIGSGAQGSTQVTERQWYILWGLVPLNTVDSNAMAAGATDYTIKTERNAVDVIISLFTMLVTIHPRSVTVTK